MPDKILKTKLPNISARTWGVLLHPTSLPGKNFSGDIGPKALDFLNFLAKAGASWWQTLPTNPADKAGSPYSTASSFAGEPLLINLEDLVKRGLLKPSEIQRSGPKVSRKMNLSRSRKLRFDAHKVAFLRAKAPGGLLSSSRFLKFQIKQAHWLSDFSLFSALTTKYKTCDWTKWPEAVKKRQALALSQMRSELANEVLFVEFQQFIFEEQWQELRKSAASRGIGLIGDIPIFVSHQSADVWSNQKIFCLDKVGKPSVVAGCPPDRFNADGQLWGNALYDWKALQKTNYDWWARRFERLLEQFDLIRLDHFIGFYRYWAIPVNSTTAKNGSWRFTPGADFFEKVIRRLKHLPLIAEDLGLVTKEVVALRERFGFPGMRIVQFGFSNGDDADHHKPHNYSHDSVVYTGTHDNETAIGYMNRVKKESRNQRKNSPSEYETAKNYLGVASNKLKTSADAMIRSAFSSISNTAIIPMQDLLSLSAVHRMNVPGTSKGNWTWRCTDAEVSDQLAIKMKFKAKIFGRIK